MEPDRIYINMDTFGLVGAPAERSVQELDKHIAKLQALLGDKLKIALEGVSESSQNETLALVSFTGAFTGLSTLLTFCSFIRGVVSLEKGMETPADKHMVGSLRKLLVPIVGSHSELLRASMLTQTSQSNSLLTWYREALAAVVEVQNFIGRIG